MKIITKLLLLSLIITIAVYFPEISIARDIYVTKSGSNSNFGGINDPYLTIKYAVGQSTSGDKIYVGEGTYSESWITIKEGTELISRDGTHKAKIYSGNQSAIRLTNNNSGIDGFEIYADWNQGAAADGLIRPYDSNNVWIKNCKVHDAPHDADVIKVGANNVLIENCIIYNAAHRTDGVSYQECVDIYGNEDPDGVIVRGCWIYHTFEKGGDYLIYAKGGAKNILWEHNIFGPAFGSSASNVSVGCGAASPAVFPACENFVARNNIFVHCTGDGAFGFTSAKNAHVYNNVFYDYTGSKGIIQFYSTQPGGTDRNEDCYVYNNIFLNSPNKPIYYDRGRWSGGAYTYIPENFQSDHNIYYQVDTSNISNDVDVLTEVNSIFQDPLLVFPQIPDTINDTWSKVIINYFLQVNSPAIDKGKDLSNNSPYNVPDDINSTTRPVNGYFDIGVHEIKTIGHGKLSPPIFLLLLGE
ncbi:MAG: hypothetical protein HQK65_01290 [Desulfamplus sp.]|nr:hypothetical protein [Desulfamplus sp.]